MRKNTLLFLISLLVACSSSTNEQLLTGNSITLFQLNIGGELVSGEINQSNNTIVFNFIDAELTSLKPTITISEGATINPSPNSSQNFNENVSYKVIAENGIERDYVVIVNNTIQNNENLITLFQFNINNEIFNGEINEENSTVNFELVEVDLSSLSQIIEISEGATITPAPDSPQNFKEYVTYTVKAENGQERIWGINIINKSSGVNFEEIEIAEDPIGGIRSVAVTDVNGDGHLDILSCSGKFSNQNGVINSKIGWYENVSGQGDFGTQQLISTIVQLPLSIESHDFDGDGDMDALSASQWDNRIAWHENLDGNGNFTQKNIGFTQNWALRAYGADIDADGDIDVIASFWDDGLYWYENTNGQGAFSTSKTIFTNVETALTIKIRDLDNDGDIDIVAQSYIDNSFFWIENLDGQGNFSELKIISNNVMEPGGVEIGDVDGDGNQDVFVSSGTTGDSATYKIVWFKNITGQGIFGGQQIISNTSNSKANYLNAIDIDEDGDIDLVATSINNANNSEIVWYENLNGRGNFSEKRIISQNSQLARSLSIVDVNGDGKLDLVCGFNNRIVFFKNITN